MNLTKLSGILKTISGPLIAILIITTLVGLIAFRFVIKTPSLPTINKPQFESVPTRTLSYKANNLESPSEKLKKLPIYIAQPQKFDLSQAASIALKLNIQTQPLEIADVNLGKGVIFASPENTIIMYEKAFVYQNNKATTAPLQNDADSQSLKDKSAQFVNNLGLGNTSFVESGISYLKFSGEEQTKVQNPSEASLVRVEPIYNLSSLPLLANINSNVIFTSQNEVYSASLNSFDKFESKEAYSLIDFDDAYKLLIRNQGAMIDIEPETEGGISSITAINLTQAYLAYYLEKSHQGLVQPVWVFEGVGEFSQIQLKVKYAVPAINPKYFNK